MQSPLESFTTSHGDAKYGQIRSAKDHSLCPAVQGVDIRPVYDCSDKERGTDKEFDTKNG